MIMKGLFGIIFIGLIAATFAKLECPEYARVLLPNPFFCQYYYRCENGSPVDKKCGVGLRFDVKTRTCVDRAVATCAIAPPSLECPGYYDVLPHPEDCTSYFSCEWGVPLFRFCWSGLYFDVKTLTCVGKAAATCAGSESPAPEVPEIPEEPEVPEKPEEPEVPEKPEKPEVPEKPKEPEVPEKPEEPEVPEKPVEPEVPEKPEEPEVPEKPEEPEVPEKPEEPEVPSPPEEQASPVECPEQMDPEDNVLLPNPKDCTTFYQCVWGRPALMHCQTGLHFNPATKECDYPSKAHCTAKPLQ